jgi:hypothetical protein
MVAAPVAPGRPAPGSGYTAAMACWRAMVRLGLVLALAGCGDEAGVPGSDGEDEASDGTTTTGGGARDVDGGGLPPAATTTFDSTTFGVGSSGAVEDTLFGMSDDMPLVTDIPDIKRGEVGVGTWVVIEQVRLTTGRASLGRDAWFYVQDPTADEHMGLRVLLQRGDPLPAEDRAVDVEGYVQTDAQGWLLELESAVEGGMQPAVPARRVWLSTLTASNAVVLDDALVDLVDPSALVITRSGTVPGTVLVGAATTSSGILLVDLRPFGLDEAVLPAGTQLSRLRGVAELAGSQPVILPRGVNDLVVAP